MTADFALQVAEKQVAREALFAEIASIRNEPEVEYHKDNEAFLKTVLSEFKMLTGEADA